MAAKPRVTAHYEQAGDPIQTHGHGVIAWPPGIEITLHFTIHDHEAALALLERATANIRAQIEVTA